MTSCLLYVVRRPPSTTRSRAGVPRLGPDNRAEAGSGAGACGERAAGSGWKDPLVPSDHPADTGGPMAGRGEEPAPRRRGRPPQSEGADTRNRILTVARQVFSE